MKNIMIYALDGRAWQKTGGKLSSYIQYFIEKNFKNSSFFTQCVAVSPFALAENQIEELKSYGLSYVHVPSYEATHLFIGACELLGIKEVFSADTVSYTDCSLMGPLDGIPCREPEPDFSELNELILSRDSFDDWSDEEILTECEKILFKKDKKSPKTHHNSTNVNTLVQEESSDEDSRIMTSDNALETIYEYMADQNKSTPLAFWTLVPRRGFLATIPSTMPDPRFVCFYMKNCENEPFAPYFQYYYGHKASLSVEKIDERNRCIEYLQWQELLESMVRDSMPWDTYAQPKIVLEKADEVWLYEPVTLVSRAHCPFFSRQLFSEIPEVIFDNSNGTMTLDLMNYLEKNHNYPVEYIWDSLLQWNNLADVRAAMHLQFALPQNYVAPHDCVTSYNCVTSHNCNTPSAENAGDTKDCKNTKNDSASNKNSSEKSPKSQQKVDLPLRAAFICHIYYMDQVEFCCSYIKNLPPEVDLYITTPSENVAELREHLKEYDCGENAQVIGVKNRGRDVSALLVGARSVLTSGKYDIIGFAHDKKSLQNQIDGYALNKTAAFTYGLWENTVASTEYIRNIFELFKSQPQLGLACPPPPRHAMYFNVTTPTDWTVNFNNTAQLLDALGVQVPLDPHKPTVSPLGSCFWFRVEAMKPLVTRSWVYKDFLAEAKMLPDGTISHAIERSWGYVAQSQGYYSAWVMTQEFERARYDLLLNATQSLMRAVAGVSIESLPLTVQAVQKALSKDNASVKNAVHNKAKNLARQVLHMLPESSQDLVRASVKKCRAQSKSLCKSLSQNLHKNMHKNLRKKK